MFVLRSGFLSLLILPMFAGAGVLLAAEPPLTIRLVSSVTSIQPGQPFYVGLALHHAPTYHTYWKHPGIVGVPTNIAWKNLPEGFTAEPIDWPEPEPVLMFQIKAQGYERDVVLPIRITPPPRLTPGTTVKLEGKASWMCCSQQCNPGFEDLAIELPIAKGPESSTTTEWNEKIQRELALRPRTSIAWQAEAFETDRTVRLMLKPSTGATAISAAEAKTIIFFSEDGLIDSNQPQVIGCQADGTLEFTLTKAEVILGDRPKSLRGVLLYKPGWEQGGVLRCLRVEPKLRH